MSKKAKEFPPVLFLGADTPEDREAYLSAVENGLDIILIGSMHPVDRTPCLTVGLSHYYDLDDIKRTLARLSNRRPVSTQIH